MPKKTALILTSGLLVAACGSSSHTNQASAPNSARGYSQALAFSRCMRAHGVSNFPDPQSGSGGGVQLSIGPNSGIDPRSRSFQAAQSSCRKFAPGIGKVSAHASAQARAHLLQISECMRAHGISGFPDPQTGQPPSNPSGYSAIIGTPGGYIALPQSINPQSPAFLRAAAACNFGPRGAGGVVTKAGGVPKGP
jgi:hypothetical protein